MTLSAVWNWLFVRPSLGEVFAEARRIRLARESGEMSLSEANRLLRNLAR